MLVWLVYVISNGAVLVRTARASGPDIPEPMVFDLVRGLGAEKGEIELNTLGCIRILEQSKGFLWAPELEYAFADGYAMEIEVPFEGTALSSLKFALQGTIGMAANDRFIHGWQTIVEYELREVLLKGTLLYLAGARLHRVFSLFVMIGVEGGYEIEKNAGHFRGIFNPSVFFNVTPHLVFGVETNLSYDLKDGFEMLLMPQLHFKFGRSWQIQFGAGDLLALLMPSPFPGLLRHGRCRWQTSY